MRMLDTMLEKGPSRKPGVTTYAALILLRFGGGCPSLFTNRICFGGATAEEGPLPVELMPEPGVRSAH